MTLRFTRFEIELVAERNGHVERVSNVENHAETFWTLYGRTEDGLAVAIGDYTTRADAEAVLDAIVNFNR